MGRARPTVLGLVAAITGDVSLQAMVNRYNNNPVGGHAIEGGGTVVLGTATTVDIQILDANDVEIVAATTFTADGVIAPIPRGVELPLKVTTTNISNSAHTVTVRYAVKK